LTSNVTKIFFPLFFFCLFFFAARAMAAQSSDPSKTGTPNLTVNESTMAKTHEDAAENTLSKKKKSEILARALRVPLGADCKAYFSLEPPHGMEALREELENKTIYRAVFGVNIPL
jgi:hypothetical protein